MPQPIPPTVLGLDRVEFNAPNASQEAHIQQSKNNTVVLLVHLTTPTTASNGLYCTLVSSILWAVAS